MYQLIYLRKLALDCAEPIECSGITESHTLDMIIRKKFVIIKQSINQSLELLRVVNPNVGISW